MGEIEVAMIARLKALALEHQLDISGGKVRRTSSRFCLGVEHGDYNGTELFGVGTDRFIWFAYKPNTTGRIRAFSDAFARDGVLEVDLGQAELPPPGSNASSWARFLHGALFVLRREGFAVSKGFDAVLVANIPGGGMSRSASLSINLLLTLLDANAQRARDDWQVVELAQKVENDYVGSPCGNLDQIMIYFAKAGKGTHYDPKTRSIRHVPLGPGGEELCLVSLDTGTDRPGLEKSTYKVRRTECDEFAQALHDAGFGVDKLAGIRDEAQLQRARDAFGKDHPNWVSRLEYIYGAQKRFGELLAAWEAGDIRTVGRIFREDGRGLRDQYVISGPELETMCDIARTVEGVLGERMLGGGDKGAAGAIALGSAEPALRRAVELAYPRAYPHLKDKFAVHTCRVVDGIAVLEGVL